MFLSKCICCDTSKILELGLLCSKSESSLGLCYLHTVSTSMMGALQIPRPVSQNLPYTSYRRHQRSHGCTMNVEVVLILNLPSIWKNILKSRARGSALSTYDQSGSRPASPYPNAIWSFVRMIRSPVEISLILSRVCQLKSNIILDLKPVLFLTSFFEL